MSDTAWLDQLRADAQTRFDAAPLKPKVDVPSTIPGTATADDLKPYMAGDETHLMVFVDGVFNPELSNLEGITAMPMAEALNYPQTRQHFETLAASDEVVDAMHLATWTDGAFVLAEGQVNLHVMFVNTGAGGRRSVHNAFVADANSELTVLESHVHLADDDGLTLSYTVMVAGDNASIKHVKVQKEDRRARHIATQKTMCLGNGRAHSVLVDIGGAEANQYSTADLLAPGAEVTLNGVFFGQRKQRTDVITRIDHRAPNCTSTQIFKGIMDDEARGAFTGLVKVHAGASGTSSDQENRNLLLSDKAHIDASPQLEIDNDDVSCSHGSTIGQLEPEQLFFLRSRGIGEPQARMMLTRAFASQVIESVDDGRIRQLLDRYLHIWFIRHTEHLEI